MDSIYSRSRVRVCTVFINSDTLPVENADNSPIIRGALSMGVVFEPDACSLRGGIGGGVTGSFESAPLLPLPLVAVSLAVPGMGTWSGERAGERGADEETL